MTDKPAEQHPLTETHVVSATPKTDAKRVDAVTKPKKSFGKVLSNFCYDPKKKTILGRSALNWAKLAAFYTVFYFCLACFFVGLLYLFALTIDGTVPTHYNTESTMAVRTSATVVGLGFRPQAKVDDSLILVTDDPEDREVMVNNLRLYRQIFLNQRFDANVGNCTAEDPADELAPGKACAFDWDNIVLSDKHPCSEKNLFGFEKEQPCVLVKLNKVYGWKPSPGPIPAEIQSIRGVYKEKPVDYPDVYIRCRGTNPADTDVLKDMVYYSVVKPNGSPDYGVIPNYYFPYKNARDHVQPFVLVQFKNLPTNRLISVTCQLYTPGNEVDSRAMRGLVAFQLYREHTKNN